VAHGVIEGIGGQASMDFVAGNHTQQDTTTMANPGEVSLYLLDWLARASLLASGGVDAVGHRVVYGGNRFVKPTRLDDDVIAAIDALRESAPLHNEPALEAIRATRARLGFKVPMVAEAIIFGGGIGENAPAVRERICANIDWCGLRLDAARNAAASDTEARISADNANLHAYVIPVDEAAIIAHDTVTALGEREG
jgi:acetate kinase